MSKSLMITLGMLGIFLLLIMGSCGVYVSSYNQLVASSTACDKGLSNIDEGYRRRADLIENLAETVKSEVGAESQLDVDYAQQRAAAGGKITLTADTLKDPKAMAAYQANQASLGNTLGRLMMISEKIPNPNFSKAYKDLRTNLEGINNRIGISIRDYNDAVEAHNNLIGSFFNNLFFGTNPKFKAREMYKVEEEKKANPSLKNMNMDMRHK